MGLAVRELFRSPLAAWAETVCRAPRGGCGPEHGSDGADLWLTRTGVYALHARGRVEIAEAGTALLYPAGEPFRISHPAARTVGDACTVVRVDDELRDELFGAPPRGHWATADRLGAAAQVVHFEALAALRDPAAGDCLAGEEATVALLGAVRRDVGLADPGAAPSAAERRRVQRVQVRLAAAPEASLGLIDLAEEAAVSPFRLCRLFKRETGLTLRRYRLRLRLAAVLARLAEGETDLARLAADLGFSHHSHLTAAFRAHFGAPPSTVRERLRRPQGADRTRF